MASGAQDSTAVSKVEDSITRLANAADAMDSWRAEGERRAQALRQSLADVKDHANNLTGQVHTRNRAAAQGERSRAQRYHVAAGSAKPPSCRRTAVPQQDIDPAESAVLNAEEHLQDYTRAMARSSDRLRKLRVATDGIPAVIEPLYGKLARSRQRWNETCNPLISLLSWGGKEGFLHQQVLAEFSVRRLWLLRSVSKHFDAWCRLALESLPRPMVLGGGLLGVANGGVTVRERLRSVEQLNLASMRWENMPSLPVPRSDAAACTLPSGAVVLVGGGEDAKDESGPVQNATAASDQATKSVSSISYDQRSRRWSGATWAPLSHPREGLAAVALPGGRVFTLGGWGEAEDQPGSGAVDGTVAGSSGTATELALRCDLSITEVSTPNRSGWTRTANMHDARTNPAAGVLGADAGRLAGRVIVAGGQCSSSSSLVLNSAEVWDPDSDSWKQLPPMRYARAGARGFVLPGGRFAVVGGMGLSSARQSSGTWDPDSSRLAMRRDTEVFSARTNAWTTLPDTCANCRMSYAGGVARGSIVIVGGEVSFEKPSDPDDGNRDDNINGNSKRSGKHRHRRIEGELYDEETERWFCLPQVQSGLGPGRTHAATTSCRMLDSATMQDVSADVKSNPSYQGPAVLPV